MKIQKIIQSAATVAVGALFVSRNVQGHPFEGNDGFDGVARSAVPNFVATPAVPNSWKSPPQASSA
jgi:hypothetical protein